MKKNLSISIVIYSLCIVLVSLFWHRQILLSFFYVLISMYMLSQWHTRSDLVFYFVPFVLGPVGEGVAVYFGAWKYSEPLYLIPLWLPLLWGIAALFVKKISESVIEAREPRFGPSLEVAGNPEKAPEGRPHGSPE